MAVSALDLPARLYLKISHDDRTGCWLWTGALAGPYALVDWQGVSCLGHRLAYKLLVGPIPFGLELDHLCRNRTCINPGHLEPLTAEENRRRAAFSRVAHPSDDLAADIAMAAGMDTRVHSADLCARLVALHPDRYDGWGPAQVGNAVRQLGVRTRQVWINGRNRQGLNLRELAVIRQLAAAHLAASSLVRDSTRV